MYKTLEDFLADGNSLNSLIDYDFKNESPWPEVQDEQNSFEKFRMYRTCNDTASKQFDCDGSNGSCPLVDNIYSKLWGWSFQIRHTLPKHFSSMFGAYWKRLGSDTMNSFSTTYRVAQSIYRGNDVDIRQNNRITRFAALTHTIGNFTLVPFQLDPKSDKRSFNQYRGFHGDTENNYFVYDFFDLSLKLIQEHTGKEAFKNYIDTFFLNDYVDSNYNVIPLFERHEDILKNAFLPLGDPDAFLPQNEDELNEYLDNVTRLIEARGKRIVAALENRCIKSMPNKKASRKSTHSTPRKAKRPLAITLTILGIWVLATVGYCIVKCIQLSEQISERLSSQGFVDAILDIFWGLIVAFVDVGKMLIIVAIIGVLAFALLRALALGIANKLLGRCQNCKKLFAYQKVGTRVIETKKISVRMELKDRYEDGTTRGTHEQYIPGTRTIYETTYCCKHCGHKKGRTYSKDAADI